MWHVVEAARPLESARPAPPRELTLAVWAKKLGESAALQESDMISQVPAFALQTPCSSLRSLSSFREAQAGQQVPAGMLLCPCRWPVDGTQMGPPSASVSTALGLSSVQGPLGGPSWVNMQTIELRVAALEGLAGVPVQQDGLISL